MGTTNRGVPRSRSGGRLGRPDSSSSLGSQDQGYESSLADAEVPVMLDASFLHRVAFTVWHAALYLMTTQHTSDVPVRSASRQKQVTMTPTGPRGRGRARDHGMDLTYITERIIALWFPEDTSPSGFRQGHQQAAQMLTSKHGNNYMVFNLSEPRRAARSQHDRVREQGWPMDLAPPLERLCSICKDIDSWLSGDSHRIAVLHARGSYERIGVVVAAYLHYSNICGSADQALDRFAMKRFLDDKVGDLDQPSHKRCWPLQCLPFLLCESNIVNLYCAQCNNFLGAYNRRLGCIVDVEANLCNPGITPNFPSIP